MINVRIPRKQEIHELICMCLKNITIKIYGKTRISEQINKPNIYGATKMLYGRGSKGNPFP
jgi:hypothetical protein